MIRFHGLDGSNIQLGNNIDYSLEDERAFLISFEKQLRTVDKTSPEQVSILQKNWNELANILGVSQLSTSGTYDQATAGAIDYYENNRGALMEYGITNHLKAKELEKVTGPAFTETEHAPTIEEMKELDINISELYNDRS